MEISNRLLENKPPITIYPGALLERPALLPAIALCIAIWGDIEARLDSIFLLIAKNEEALAGFMEAKGWGGKRSSFTSGYEMEAIRSLPLRSAQSCGQLLNQLENVIA